MTDKTGPGGHTGYSDQDLQILGSWFDLTGYLMINLDHSSSRRFATIIMARCQTREDALFVHHLAPDRTWPVAVGGTSATPRKTYTVWVANDRALDLLQDLQPYVHVQKRALALMIKALRDYEIIKDPQFLKEDPVVKRAKRRIQQARRELRAANQKAAPRKREIRRALAEIQKNNNQNKETQP